jgi:hypothetical protein
MVAQQNTGVPYLPLVLVFRGLLWRPKLRVESLYLAFHPVSSPYPVLLVFINI